MLVAVVAASCNEDLIQDTKCAALLDVRCARRITEKLEMKGELALESGQHNGAPLAA